MNKRISYLYHSLVVIILLLSIFFVVFSSTEIVSAEENTVLNQPSIKQSNCEIEYKESYEGDKAYITITLHKDLKKYSIVSNTFNDYEMTKTANSISIILSLYEEKEALFTINIYIKNSKKEIVNIYGLKNDNLIFINDYSNLKNYENKNKALYKDNLIDIDNFYNFYKNEGLVREKSINIKESDNNLINYTNDEGNTYVQGKIRCIDRNGDYYPIRCIKVELYDYNSTNSITKIGETYTDENGDYLISFVNADSILDLENGGYDVFIKIISITDNIRVINGENSVFEYATSMQSNMNVETGSTTYIDVDFSLAAEIFQGIYITQPLVFAERFVKDVSGSTPPLVYCKYSSSLTNTLYNPSYSQIELEEYYMSDSSYPNAYESWDVIIHEYAHHIQFYLNINHSTGDIHSLERNSIENYLSSGMQFNDAFNKGSVLAWTEAWATAFSMMVQKNYPVIRSIPFVGDYYFNSDDYCFDLTDPEEIPLDLRGEGCEGSIISVLLSLCDAGLTEHNETILSNQEWWDYTTRYETFYEFIEYLYNHKGEKKYKVGEILERYNFASSIKNIIAPTELGENNSLNILPFKLGYTTCGSSNLLHNEFQLNIYNYNLSQRIDNVNFNPDLLNSVHIVEGNSYNWLTDSIIDNNYWQQILSWEGDKIYISILSKTNKSNNNIYFYSSLYEIEKPVYKYVINRDSNSLIKNYRIDGFCKEVVDVEESETVDSYIVFPNTVIYNELLNITGINTEAFINDEDIVSVTFPSNYIEIKERAFFNCSNLTYLTMDSVVTIGEGAFKNCNFFRVSFSNNLEIIGNEAFYNSGTISQLPNSITRIGEYAFYNCDIKDLILTSTTNIIGAHAFNNCNNTTFYIEQESIPSSWSSQWNSSNRPVIWGCTLSSDKSYVVSVNTNNLQNANAVNGITNPTRKDYTFGGWYTSSDYTGTQYMNLSTAPTGILYAKWNSSSSSCIVEGTKITLANGSLINVEELTGDEELLVWDMFNGCYSTAPILFIDAEELNIYNVINLIFSDGTVNKIVSDHGFFDMTLNRYVYIKENNYLDYIGHYFNKGDNEVQLVQAYIQQEFIRVYSPVTYGHLCYYVNGMLSMPGNTESFANIFDIDNNTLTYINIEQDIAEYGLYTYEEFNSIIELPEYVFNAFNGQYLKIAIGKGITTLEEIQILLDRYLVYLN